ncbi:MAG: hypothetical protein KG003_04065 [Bacteroidetes bacterium]|nr:hypothetical protein [Bacteroidota bacterium]
MHTKKKTTTILFGLLVIVACSSTQKTNDKEYFEGKIMYKNEFVIKTNKVDSAYLDKAFGKAANLYFKEGNYLELYDGGTMLEQLYLKQDNKTYVRKNQSDTLYWYDCGRPGQKMLKFEINPKKEKILGIDCDELVTYYPNKTVSFYFNSDTLRINPEWHRNFTAFNKNLNTQNMKAVYLKYKIEYPDFIATVTATTISRQQIDNKLFSVPKNKILIEDK